VRHPQYERRAFGGGYIADATAEIVFEVRRPRKQLAQQVPSDSSCGRYRYVSELEMPLAESDPDYAHSVVKRSGGNKRCV